MRRVKKLQEFSAHGSNVNCVKIGRRTGDLLVTGGDDRKVNVWAIGHNKARASLSGHQGAVEAVAFDGSEEFVAAGSAGGSVKLWDVEQGRVNRSFTGHRTHIRTVEFHPSQGEVIASGAADTQVKVWDVRRKLCLHTYTGHVKGVGSIAFSPDGQWLATGSEDGEIKLWDLRTCEELHSFKGHLGKITGIQYHPREHMLATASADRTVRLWDLDHFKKIGSIGGVIAGVRGITFAPDGNTLLKALPHGLEVLGWEPPRVHDIVDVPWKHVADIGVSNGHNRVIGCAFKQVVVQLWSVNLKYVQPFSGSQTVLHEKKPPRAPVTDSGPRKPSGNKHSSAKLTPSSSETSLYRTSSIDTWDSDADSMKGLKNVPVNNANTKCGKSASLLDSPVPTAAPSPRVRTSVHGHSSSTLGAKKSRPSVRRDDNPRVATDTGDLRQSGDTKSTGSMRQRSSVVVGHSKSRDGKDSRMVGGKKGRPSSGRDNGIVSTTPGDLRLSFDSMGSSKVRGAAVVDRPGLNDRSASVGVKAHPSPSGNGFLGTTDPMDLQQSCKATSTGAIKQRGSAVVKYSSLHDAKSSSSVVAKKSRPSSRYDNGLPHAELGDLRKSYRPESLRSMRQHSLSIDGCSTARESRSSSVAGAIKARSSSRRDGGNSLTEPGSSRRSLDSESLRSMRQHSLSIDGSSTARESRRSNPAGVIKVRPSSRRDSDISLAEPSSSRKNIDSESLRSMRQRSSSISGCPTPRESRTSSTVGAKKVRPSSHRNSGTLLTEPGALGQSYDPESVRSMRQRSSSISGCSTTRESITSSVVGVKKVHPSLHRDGSMLAVEHGDLRYNHDSESLRSTRQRSSSISGCSTARESRTNNAAGSKKVRPSLRRENGTLMAADPDDLQHSYDSDSVRSMRQRSSSISGCPIVRESRSSSVAGAVKVRPSSCQDNGLPLTESGSVFQSYDSESLRSMRQRSASVSGCPAPRESRSSSVAGAKKVRPTLRRDNGLVMTEPDDLRHNYDSDSLRSMRQRSSSISGCPTPRESRASSAVGARKVRPSARDSSFLVTTDPGDLRHSYDSDSAGSMRPLGSAIVGCTNPPNGQFKQSKRPSVRSAGLHRSSSELGEGRQSLEIRRCGSAEMWRPRLSSRSPTQSDVMSESGDLRSSRDLLSSVSSLKTIPERRKDARGVHGRPASGSRPGNMSFDSLLPRRTSQGGETKKADGKSDIELVSEVMSKRSKMQQILASRHSNLQLLRSFWTRGDVRGALRAAQRCGDPSVVTDFLDAVGPKNGAFTLELIPEVTPSIDELVVSQHQKYRETALATLSTLLRSFGPVIHETTSSNLGSLGVDLSFEQRQEKCHSAKMSLQELVPKLEMLESRQGLHGRQAKELRRRISDL